MPDAEVVQRVLDAVCIDPTDWQVDSLLYSVGRHVLAAAWHEDQRPAMLVSKHFKLPWFAHAVELLYLCLSGELCELRRRIDGDLIEFFEHAYRQPAIRAFLRKLDGLDGNTINEIPLEALKLYGRLSRSFGDFIEQKVLWGDGGWSADPPARWGGISLYKLIFANLNRLHHVADRLRSDTSLARARLALEKDAHDVIDCIVG